MMNIYINFIEYRVSNNEIAYEMSNPFPLLLVLHKHVQMCCEIIQNYESSNSMMVFKKNNAYVYILLTRKYTNVCHHDVF